MNRWRTIGVIGGMGPAATADFVARLVAAVPAERDIDHPRILVDSNPSVPDRNAALAGTGPSPGPVLAVMARGLVAQGAELLAMPCNAAHGWAGDIRAATDAVFVDMIEAAAARVAASGSRRVGLLAVTATVDANLYQDRLATLGIACVEPDTGSFAAAVARVKAGERGAGVTAAMVACADDLIAAGADSILAACTEVPLVLAPRDLRVPLIDATDALVAATLAIAAR